MLHNFDRVAETYHNVESENLKILYYDLEKGYKDTYNSYNYYRLCTILNGKKEIAINNSNKMTYTPSEYIVLPPQSSVDMNIASHTKAVVYEISNHLIENISNKMEQNFFKDKNIQKYKYSTDLFNAIKNLNFNIYQNDKEAQFLMDLHAQELVYRLIKDNKNSSTGSIANINYNPAEIARDIITKPGNEYLSIGEIADMLKMSQSNLDYYFKKEYNISPKKYQNQIKIERAPYLLTQNNVTEVAMNLGFENISYFIRLFKDKYGYTPKQYKGAY